MASGNPRRSGSRRSIILGERMGPPKLFEGKRPESVMHSRPSQFTKPGPSRPSTGFSTFGAQPKRSSILSTSSIYQPARSTRGSSICSGLTLKKDPRPLSDKSFQSRSTKRLVEFLVEKGYPSRLSSNLHLISKQEFVRIFNFLAELLHPSLAVPGVKLDEEMPAKLKLIGYPFPPPKSCFKAVGTPHSWPLLLGILLWLIDKNHMCAGGPMKYLAVDSDGFPIDPKESTDVASFEMYCMMYKEFMSGGGESSPGFKACVKMNLQAREEMCAKLRKRKEGMLLRIAELDKKKSLLGVSTKEDLQVKLKETIDQKIQMARYVEELQGQVQQAVCKLDQLHRSINDHEMQLEEVQVKQKELETKVKEQPISAKEAHKLKEQEYQLQYAIAQDEQETKRSYQCVAELQMSHNRSIQEIDRARQQINDKLRKITSLMASWSSALPCPELPLIGYDTNKRANCEVFKSLMDQAKHLKGELDKLYERVSQRISSMENEIITGEETESVLSSELYSKKIENEELQAQVNRKTKQLQSTEEGLNAAIKKDAVEKQELEEQLHLVQQSIQKGYMDTQELDRKILEAENDLKDIDNAYVEKITQFKEFLDVCVSYISASREYFNKSRQNVSAASKRLDEYLSKVPLN